MSSEQEGLFKIFEQYFSENYNKSVESPNYHSVVDVCYIDVFLEYPHIIDIITTQPIDKMLMALSAISMTDKELENIFMKMNRYSLIKDNNHNYKTCKNIIYQVIKSYRNQKNIVTYNDIRVEAYQMFRQIEFMEIVNSLEL